MSGTITGFNIANAWTGHPGFVTNDSSNTAHYNRATGTVERRRREQLDRRKWGIQLRHQHERDQLGLYLPRFVCPRRHRRDDDHQWDLLRRDLHREGRLRVHDRGPRFISPNYPHRRLDNFRRKHDGVDGRWDPLFRDPHGGGTRRGNLGHHQQLHDPYPTGGRVLAGRHGDCHPE